MCSCASVCICLPASYTRQPDPENPSVSLKGRPQCAHAYVHAGLNAYVHANLNEYMFMCVQLCMFAGVLYPTAPYVYVDWNAYVHADLMHMSMQIQVHMFMQS